MSCRNSDGGKGCEVNKRIVLFARADWLTRK